MVKGKRLLDPAEPITLRLNGDYSMREENSCGGVLRKPVRSLTRGPYGFPVASPNTLLPLLQFLGAIHQVAPAGASYIRRRSTTPGVDYRSDTKDWGVSGALG